MRVNPCVVTQTSLFPSCGSITFTGDLQGFILLDCCHSNSSPLRNSLNTDLRSVITNVHTLAASCLEVHIHLTPGKRRGKGVVSQDVEKKQRKERKGKKGAGAPDKKERSEWKKGGYCEDDGVRRSLRHTTAKTGDNNLRVGEAERANTTRKGGTRAERLFCIYIGGVRPNSL